MEASNRQCRNRTTAVPHSGEESSGVANMNPGQAVMNDKDHYLPLASIKRVMRQVLPSHARIADDAKEIVQECVSEFIDHVTKLANEKRHKESRGTIKPEHIIWAMSTLGMDNHAEVLALYLHKMRNPNVQAVSTSQPQLPTYSPSMSFGQPEARAATWPLPVVSYEPRPSVYPVDGNYYGPSPQANREYMYNVGGNGGTSSSNLEFDMPGQFK